MTVHMSGWTYNYTPRLSGETKGQDIKAWYQTPSYHGGVMAWGIMAKGTASKYNNRYHTIIDGAMVYAVVHMFPIFRAVAVVSLAWRSKAGRVCP